MNNSIFTKKDDFICINNATYILTTKMLGFEPKYEKYIKFDLYNNVNVIIEFETQSERDIEFDNLHNLLK